MEEKVKIQIKSIFGKLLFEWESEDNTIKETVEKAIKESADLRFANLSFADLSSADLSSADLSSANLSFANLSSANLSSADLSFANLSSAKNKEFAHIPMFCKWNVSLLGEKIKIGCKEKSIEEWDLFFSGTDEFETKRGTEQFKQIEAMYLGYKAYLLHLQK